MTIIVTVKTGENEAQVTQADGVPVAVPANSKMDFYVTDSMDLRVTEENAFTTSGYAADGDESGGGGKTDPTKK